MSLKKRKYIIENVYTDGSTFNNNKQSLLSRGGYGIYWGPNDPRNKGSPFLYSPITNNRCELFAILMAIQIFLEKKRSQSSILNIFSDSQYSLNTITKWMHGWKKNNWKKKDGKTPENLDLIQLIDNLISGNHAKFYFHHVSAAHDYLEPTNKASQEWKHWNGNHQADKLAREGALKKI